MRKRSARGQILAQLALALLALFVLVPIWGLAYVAFDGAIKGWPITFRVWPEQPTLAVFAHMWLKPSQNLSFLGLLGNSLLVAGGAALLSVGFGTSMAYAFARYRFPGRRAGLFALLVGALLPPVAFMTPLYILLGSLHLRTSLLGLTLVYTAFSMPFCIWNMRAAFSAVPKELEESAFLDGASPWVAFWRISLPLALPAIAIAALIAFLIGYSEFALGWLFVSRGQDVTLAMAVSGIFEDPSPQWSNMAALALMMSAPVIVLFLVLQKYLLNSLSLGTVDA
jgi:arabinogalactan oligomer/maltooligosaccharide transport system permease protein